MISQDERKSIQIFGIGGGGVTVLNQIYNQAIPGLELLIIDTDARFLKESDVPKRLQIGVSICEGFGTDGNLELGRRAAIECRDTLNKAINKQTKFLILVASFGGGTGTGGLPIISKIAKNKNVTMVAIVTLPFIFEGREKHANASDGITSIKKDCDTILIINNESLKRKYKNLPLRDAPYHSNYLVRTLIWAILGKQVISQTVMTDLDFTINVYKRNSIAILGTGYASEKGFLLHAVKNACACHLLNDAKLNMVSNILVSIVYSDQDDILLEESSQVAAYLEQEFGKHVRVIFKHSQVKNIEKGFHIVIIGTSHKVQDVAYSTKHKIKFQFVEHSDSKGFIIEDKDNHKVPNSYLLKRYQDRKMSQNEESKNYLLSENFGQDMWERYNVPAYIRRMVNLQPIHSNHYKRIVHELIVFNKKL